MTWRRWDGPDLVLEVKVQPWAGRDELAGLHGDRLKVRITAAPVEGQANDHLLRFLARLFGVARQAVVLEAGSQGRNKRLRIKCPAALPPQLPP